MDKNTQQINWINYAVTIIIGLAFSVIILIISWNNALETEKREFTLASSSIKDSVSRNVKTANDTLNSLTAFFEVNPNINQQQFSQIVLSLLGIHPFMEGAICTVLESNDTGIQNTVKTQFNTMRDSNYINTDREFNL